MMPSFNLSRIIANIGRQHSWTSWFHGISQLWDGLIASVRQSGDVT
jgi:hypothetical protein